MNYDLPEFFIIDGKSHVIRYDFRAILDILAALNDINLSEKEKAVVSLQIFYVDFQEITNMNAALKKIIWFINGGKEETETKRSAKTFDWEQDWEFIISAVNRVIGTDVRRLKPYHWWSFLSAFNEIGECTLTTIMNIRRKKSSGKKLEKYEQDFYRNNRSIIDFKQKFTDEEKTLLGIE